MEIMETGDDKTFATDHDQRDIIMIWIISLSVTASNRLIILFHIWFYVIRNKSANKFNTLSL